MDELGDPSGPGWTGFAAYVCIVAVAVGLVAYVLDRRRRALPEAFVPSDADYAYGASSLDPKDRREPTGAACGCVFDIDGTLTCGDPSGVVALCKARGCAIGINTARPAPWAPDVPLRAQGFPETVVAGKDFYYNPSPTPQNVVPRKVEGLRRFQHRWGIRDPRNVLFFDDDRGNVRGARAAGYTAILCSVERCGIGAPQEAAAERALMREDFRAL